MKAKASQIEALADPIAIFDSDTEQGDLVFMLDLKDANDATVIVPVTLNGTDGSSARLNIAKSAYSKETNGRPNDQWFVRQVQKNARYVNRQKWAEWTSTPGSNSLLGVQTTQTTRSQVETAGSNSLWNHPNALNSNIKTEADLVKLKNVNPSQYQSMGNPKGAFNRKAMDISLFAKADESTFMHESAHLC